MLRIFMFLAEVSPYGLAIESLRFDDGKGCKGLRLSSNVWSIYGVWLSSCLPLATYVSIVFVCFS